ncbi:hypothetical protein [Gordonia sp. MP11Mi]|uniref:hypothetical protein n=1 Tax=Gordonia sp. MP11Mi TaxID=3022769 RepID=UPI003B226540
MAAPILAVAAAVDGHWWQAVVVVVLAAFYVRTTVRGRRSRRAVSEWTPERVREVVADPTDSVRAVRVLRDRDRRLTLADAVAVVTAAE